MTMQPTMKLRWVETIASDKPIASRWVYDSHIYYKLQQWWQALDSPHGEWVDVDWENEE